MDEPITKKTFYLILLVMEAGILAIALAIAYCRNVSLMDEFLSSIQTLAILLSLICGMLIGCVPYYLAKIPKLESTYNSIINKLVGFKINLFDCVVISLIAGLCEELLFRGVLQSWLGLWITSILFMLVHGYWNILDYGKMAFGLIVFIISVFAGILYKYWGLSSAVAFHFACDLSAYYLLGKQKLCSSNDMVAL